MSLDEPTSDDRLRARLKVLDEAVRDLGDEMPPPPSNHALEPPLAP